MERKIIEKEIFIANDWTEFLKEKDCVTYEKEISNLLSQMKYFKVLHSCDENEWKCWTDTTYFAVLDNPHLHIYRVIEYLINKFKGIFKGLGKREYNEWCLPIEITKLEFDKGKNKKLSNVVFLSKQENEFTLEQFGKASWIKPILF